MSEMYSAPVTVLGAGSYGTALAIALARNGHKTYLWGHQPEKMAVLATERMNNAFLPDIAFPDALEIESDLVQAIAKAKDILIVVPSHVFADVLKQIKPLLSAHHRIMWATKGLERNTGRLLQTVAQEILGNQYPLAYYPGRHLPKNSLKVYRQLSHYPQQTANLPMKCSNVFTVLKRFESI
ncbi:putative NAD(P)H-dependent glycerol-3-phosphate dehydrogenase [Actinobacillus pleuropneumoniae]|nr:putative NAD(P)H-dependent glycerol-3-phosphate dehydrogenase [Actinobacillus pleuropneumoniae]KIE89491.1 putative NAD(P)H-dependent glycerol-3-phosphate dehydrogenase [Actinobacillus pleuropneumoniae]KIE94675.1 putative NAD(P)H-dependent glycerol-3-phosphate dehydrogenase [Actinobacillus pleuropneumoniae]KIE95855.1 putative NAD(P)H-dependent glycerol-3-phosphate dehydrogenase [Actinobacillus pleuropneumoniae]